MAPTPFPKDWFSSSRLVSRLEARPTLFSPIALPEPYQEPTGLQAYMPACRPCREGSSDPMSTATAATDSRSTTRHSYLGSIFMAAQRLTIINHLIVHLSVKICLAGLVDSSVAAWSQLYHIPTGIRSGRGASTTNERRVFSAFLVRLDSHCNF